jgi:low temperature requirement protein LtrA
VNGLSQQQWQLASAIAGILGLTTAFSLGWLYFDNLSSRAIKAAHTTGQVGIYQIWLYTHLPLVISITAIGVGVKHVISSNPELALPTGERWLICGAVALCFLTLGILQCTDTIPSRKRRARHRLIGVLIAGTLAIVGQGLLPIAAIGAIAMLGIVQIVLDLSQTQEVAGI